jgi:hypothetical protein
MFSGAYLTLLIRRFSRGRGCEFLEARIIWQRIANCRRPALVVEESPPRGSMTYYFFGEFEFAISTTPVGPTLKRRGCPS